MSRYMSLLTSMFLPVASREPSLAKTFSLHENWHAEFRADALNVFNHTQWNGVQTTYPYATVGNYGNVPFGQATGAREARIMQVALKLAF